MKSLVFHLKKTTKIKVKTTFYRCQNYPKYNNASSVSLSLDGFYLLACRFYDVKKGGKNIYIFFFTNPWRKRKQLLLSKTSVKLACNVCLEGVACYRGGFLLTEAFGSSRPADSFFAAARVLTEICWGCNLEAEDSHAPVDGCSSAERRAASVPLCTLGKIALCSRRRWQIADVREVKETTATPKAFPH